MIDLQQSFRHSAGTATRRELPAVLCESTKLPDVELKRSGCDAVRTTQELQRWRSLGSPLGSATRADNGNRAIRAIGAAFSIPAGCYLSLYYCERFAGNLAE